MGVSFFSALLGSLTTSQPSGQPPGGQRSGFPAVPSKMDLKKSLAVKPQAADTGPFTKVRELPL